LGLPPSSEFQLFTVGGARPGVLGLFDPEAGLVVTGRNLTEHPGFSQGATLGSNPGLFNLAWAPDPFRITVMRVQKVKDTRRKGQGLTKLSPAPQGFWKIKEERKNMVAWGRNSYLSTPRPSTTQETSLWALEKENRGLSSDLSTSGTSGIKKV